MKILCLEDELNTAIAIKTFLAPDEVIIKTTLKEAIEALHKNAFSFAIIDLNLPDSEGIATLKALDEFDIPKMVITADVNEDISSAATFLAHAPIDYVLKLDYPGVHLLKKIRFNVERTKKNSSFFSTITFETFEEIKHAIAAPIHHKHLVAH